MVEYDERTALVIVDVQNDFADPAGSLYVAEGERIIPMANREIERASASGAFIAYTQDWHPERTPHFMKDGGIWPVHCVGGTWGAQLHPELEVKGEVIRKGTEGEDGYSGFTVRDATTGEDAPTPLTELLRDRGIVRVVILGLATDYCVKETALDALELGFETILLRDGIRAVDLESGDGARAMETMEAAGASLR